MLRRRYKQVTMRRFSLLANIDSISKLQSSYQRKVSLRFYSQQKILSVLLLACRVRHLKSKGIQFQGVWSVIEIVV